MKRVAVFILLAVLNVAGATPSEVRTQHGVAYGHQSQKQAQQAAEKQRKQSEKAARKQLKKAEKYQTKQQRAIDKTARKATKQLSHASSGKGAR